MTFNIAGAAAAASTVLASSVAITSKLALIYAFLLQGCPSLNDTSQ